MGDKTNIIKKFYKCLYDVESFSKYAKEGIKSAIIYILILASVLGAIKGAVRSYNINRLISSLNDVFIESEYNFHINNGILGVSKSPITIEKDGLVVYINDEVPLKNENEIINIAENLNAGIVILEDGMIYLEDNSITSEVKYSEIFENGIIDNNTLISRVENLKIKAQIIVFSLNIVSTIAILASNLLIVVIIGSFISIILRMVVRLKALWSLVIYSSTLPLLLITILEILRPRINFDAAFILGNLTYLVIILLSIKADIINRIKSGKI